MVVSEQGRFLMVIAMAVLVKGEDKELRCFLLAPQVWALSHLLGRLHF
jgi:hypothetical protein